MPAKHTIPLFPLGLVLLPGTTLPLHIFEKRYIELYNDCIRNDSEFGIVYYNGSALRSAGCTARIMRTIESRADGRLDILCNGNRRFEILDLMEGKPYLQAQVRFFDDEDEQGLTGLAIECIDALEELSVLADKHFDRPQRMSPQSLSFVLANTDLLNLEERQFALETRSCRERLEKALRAAHVASERLKSAKRLQNLLGFAGDISHLFN